MDMLMTVLVYVFVFGAAAVLALVPGVIAYFVSKKRLGKWWSYFAGLLVVLCVLASFSQKPFLTYTQEVEVAVTQEQEDAIRSVCGGAYSVKAPLIPMLIMVEDTDAEHLVWTEYYFPYGNRRMELTGDGFNCTKNLLPW